jgi:adenosine deaminase
MPKGADLHSHLSGAVYAESYLRWAAEDGACVSVRGMRIVNPPCTATPDTDHGRFRRPEPGALRCADRCVLDAQLARGRLHGHAQFFGTFGRFGALPRRTGDMLAEASARAAAGRVSYLELMQTADGRAARSRSGSGRLARRLRRDARRADGGRDAAGRGPGPRQPDGSGGAPRHGAGCGTAAADPGCGVEVRWLYQVARANPPEQVFAQILMGFLLPRADPRVVGFNLVQPEDRLAMRDYSLHMRMIGHLAARYPGVGSRCTPASWRRGWCRPRGCARTSARRWRWRAPGASATGWR